ncbi:glycosyl hydrolase [Neptunitalea sp. Y10]|uniref:Glycosyl hydrolase n=1 Tax=Neptunitalea lumnitzerae TaxID=2965509 RepID=A0ABQ5MJI9_9FLAO|nr:glycosyl hydrolase [Neptunitalea sp. Y10]
MVVILGVGGYWYISSNFLSFEDNYPEKTKFTTLSEDGYKYKDRNGNKKLDIYEDGRRSIEERVENALALMTLEEKIHLLKGSGMKSGAGLSEPGEGIPGAVGTIVPTPRLGLPTIYLSDGPAGLRIEPKRDGEEKTYYCTAFPIATLLSSTWNEKLVNEVGNAMGNEALEYGIDVILGPGVNIQRHPFCGRNFEYYSEDPYLTGKIGVAMVNGIEENGIGTSVKHFVANNQETQRVYNDVIVSDRALHEIYLKGFEMIVKEAQPWTIMSSYNLVNGTYVSENKTLLTDVLRNDWGYKGVVMSDWFGGNDAVAQVKAGNDLLEPGTNKQWKQLKEASKEGELSEATINISVKRILRLVFMSQKMKGYVYTNNPDLKKHAQITRESASEGMVLLKNKNTLPLQSNLNIALLGITSYDFIAGGTGSGDVNEAYTISLEEGLTNSGFLINSSAFDIYNRHKENNKDAFKKPEGINAMFTPYTPPQINYSKEELDKIANTSDLAIITIGRNAGEGTDRIEKGDFILTKDEREMIVNATDVFHKHHKKVIVVLNISGVIETDSWKNIPDAILLAWQGGQEGGNSVADILSGKVNPSGKLPMTFPLNIKDYQANDNFPLDGEEFTLMDILHRRDAHTGSDRIKNKDFTNYEEGIYVGYRDFDIRKKQVSYPFGFGLSYTNFKMDSVQTAIVDNTIEVKMVVKNIGNVKGKEVIQVYTSKPNSNIERPLQELKGFSKTSTLQPGASEDIIIKIPVDDLKYWDEKKGNWSLEKGIYIVRVGTSSRAIKVTNSIEIK